MLIEIIQVVLELAILLTIVMGYAYISHLEEELEQTQEDNEKLISVIESQRRKEIKRCRETQAG